MTLKYILPCCLWVLLVSFSFFAPKALGVGPLLCIEKYPMKVNTCTICSSLKSDLKAQLYLTSCALYEYETYDRGYAQNTDYWQIKGKKDAYEIIYNFLDVSLTETKK